MKNVKYSVTKDELTITVKLTERLGRSKSGKSMMVASTEGIVPIEGTNIKFGLNVFTQINNWKGSDF